MIRLFKYKFDIKNNINNIAKQIIVIQLQI